MSPRRQYEQYAQRLAEGFRGRVFCTPATADLCKIVLPDAGRIEEEDAREANRRGYSKHSPALPLFTEGDAFLAISRLQPVGFDRPVPVTPGVTVRFVNSGHLLGSAFAVLTLAVDGGRELVPLGRDGLAQRDQLGEIAGQLLRTGPQFRHHGAEQHGHHARRPGEHGGDFFHVHDVEIVVLAGGEVAADAHEPPDIPFDAVGGSAVPGGDLDHAHVLVSGDSPLERAQRHHDEVVLIRAHRGLAFGLEQADDFAGELLQADAAADGALAPEELVPHGLADDAHRGAQASLARRESASALNAAVG